MDDKEDVVKIEPCIIKNNSNGSLSIYLYSEIIESFKYVDAVDSIINHNAKKMIDVHINSPGGMLDSAIPLIDAMRNRKNIRTIIDGDASSCAGMLAICVKDVTVMPFAYMLCHAPTCGYEGKAHEIKSWNKYNESYVAQLCYDIYKGFMTEDEIKSMLEGKDYWFDAKEIERRLELRYK